MKAKLIGVEKLRRYDIYAPVAQADKRYSYDQAVKLTLQAYNEFDPKLEQLARRVFDASHVDSQPRKGKRGGAFCSSGDPALTPWVLLSYTGMPRDVSTLAHEFGHAIHAMLAEHHNVFTTHSSLPLAETASTFGEMLLVDKLLEQEVTRGAPRHPLRQGRRFVRHHHAPGCTLRSSSAKRTRWPPAAPRWTRCPPNTCRT